MPLRKVISVGCTKQACSIQGPWFSSVKIFPTTTMEAHKLLAIQIGVHRHEVMGICYWHSIYFGLLDLPAVKKIAACSVYIISV